ncbi:TrlF family AAA-like ATPase [Pseudomonas xanthosomatis]|uniref:TrlF family AAA-like ATPase n=1 Tax=Pseudomonas xanthosomatis TaxID=2842356 RepID=UPI003510FA7A
MTIQSGSVRGSEWRQWDLHIHTPASFEWRGAKFDRKNPASPDNTVLVDQMIKALNEAEPAVFALMDYWTFDGWFALKRRLAEPNAPKLTKTVFPGIELRLAAPMKGRLNAHVLFSNELDDQILKDFLSHLRISLNDRPLSDAALIDFARGAPDALLKHHGMKPEQVASDDEQAYIAGAKIIELTCESYKEAIAKVPDDQAIGFMPYDTSDGLNEVKWTEHYSYFLGLVRCSPIFESRNAEVRSAFVGEQTPGNAKFYAGIRRGLSDVSRLVVAGSDAHCFVGKPGENDRRGYGDFPSDKKTWIKADPTFRGLQQAIREPSKRSYIGLKPPKLEEIAANKTYFIDRVEISKVQGSPLTSHWLGDVQLPLNSDLVAIIGNKGSGKSALADVLALLGHSRQSSHFSFLRKERFRGKAGEPARQFEGSLSWHDGNISTCNLNSDPPAEKVEMVKYIPQGHFEELCNAHVTGQSQAFENELRSVIFSHADESIRLGALDFDQLIERQESTYRLRLNEFRKDLKRINLEIASFESQLHPLIKKNLNEQLELKRRQLEEHRALKPADVEKPSVELSPEQRETAEALEAIAEQLKRLEEQRTHATETTAQLAAKSKAVRDVREQVRLLQRTYEQFVNDTKKDLDLLGLSATDLTKLEVSLEPLVKLEERVLAEQSALGASSTAADAQRQVLVGKQTEAKTKLDQPQLLYQNHLHAVEEWEQKYQDLVGSDDSPETVKGLEARIAQIDAVPELLAAHRSLRKALTGEIYDILDAQRQAREALFKPVQDLIQGNSLIREEYKLQFKAMLGGAIDAFAGNLFTLLKQSVGEFRGEDDSFNTVRRLGEAADFDKREEAIGFALALHDKIAAAAATIGDKVDYGIESMLRKDKNANEVYDLLFDLSYLEPRYSLLFQDAQIEQLSPGQRGALLLIFYLLVDKGRNPIILDQPEENLDNETVVSLLVPVLTEAKKRRQIIMVTHNPNLAVVCDAEQIIWSHFDRAKGQKISYSAGAIENPSINSHAVKVLEGTKPAFDNRRIKYH